MCSLTGVNRLLHYRLLNQSDVGAVAVNSEAGDLIAAFIRSRVARHYWPMSSFPMRVSCHSTRMRVSASEILNRRMRVSHSLRYECSSRYYFIIICYIEEDEVLSIQSTVHVYCSNDRLCLRV